MKLFQKIPIGSLDGENSNSRLHNVDEATTIQSTLGLGDSKIEIRGFHTEWSWNVVLRCWTDLEKECKQPTAAICKLTSLLSWRDSLRWFMRSSVLMIFLRISSSVAAKAEKTLKAALFMSLLKWVWDSRRWTSCSSLCLKKWVKIVGNTDSKICSTKPEAMLFQLPRLKPIHFNEIVAMVRIGIPHKERCNCWN